MATRVQGEPNARRQPIKVAGKVKSKSVLESIDGCNGSKIERLGRNFKGKEHHKLTNKTNMPTRCNRGAIGRTALGNIENIQVKPDNVKDGGCKEKRGGKTRLKEKIVTSKVMNAIRSIKGQHDQPKSTSETDVIMDVDVKANSSDISDATMHENQPCKESSFSLPIGVDNIDAECSKDPQMCAENAQKIIAYMKRLELLQEIKPKFLASSFITGKMRSVLINWLAEVHLQFKLLQETLYLTVAIVDRYLSLEAQPVKRQKIQLVGVTAMLIACKYEEMYIPQVEDFVYVTDNAYDVPEILRMELQMLHVLKFQLGRPLAITFLRRNSKAGCVDIMHHLLSKYILEGCMVEYALAHVAPSEMAASALLLSIKLMEPEMQFQTIWKPNLSYYSGYQVGQLLETIQKMAKIMKDIHTSKFSAAYTKYSSASNQKIAQHVATNTKINELLSKLAEGKFLRSPKIIY